MDFNFADIKKETTAAVSDIFDRADDAKKHAQDILGTYDEVLDNKVLSDGGEKKDDKKDIDIDPLDPQAFVQRMSAGAKEAQEQLDAKFSKNTSDLEDFLGQSTNNAKQGVASLTNDFMNAERGFMASAGDAAKDIEKKAAQAVDDIFGHFAGSGDNTFKPSAPVDGVATTANNQFTEFDDDDDETTTATPAMTTFGKTAATGVVASNKDSDNDSPSISYNPSPAKKLPATDALKEQDNEKFISSEDLLGDFKDERTATPDSQASANNFSAPLVKLQENKTTDLDADDFDDDFVQAEIPKQPEPAMVATPPVVEPQPTVAARPAPVMIPEPVKEQPAPVKETKKETPPPTPVSVVTPAAPAPAPAPATAPVATKPSAPKPSSVTAAQQPNIVSVEDIFYKYGLGKSITHTRTIYSLYECQKMWIEGGEIIGDWLLNAIEHKGWIFF